MSGATALKKINARVKVLAKKHPGKKRTTLQKQAGKEYREGKLKKRAPAKRKATHKRKKAVVKRVKAAPRKRVRKSRPVAKRKVYKAKVVKVKAYKGKRYKRVSGIGKLSSLVPIVAVAGLGLVAYYLYTKSTTPTLNTTTNPYRAQAQTSILQWAALAGMTATAIANLINSINASDDNTVIQAAADPGAYYNPMGSGI